MWHRVIADGRSRMGQGCLGFSPLHIAMETPYRQVQMSGFTSAGAGIRSPASFFKTKHKGRFDLGLIGGVVVVGLVLICGSPVIKRLKVVLWPSIPNPRKSDTMQRIDGADELEPMEAIDILTVEEWDFKSLHVLETEAADVQPSASEPPYLSVDDEDWPGRSSGWAEEGTDNARISSSDPDVSLDAQQANVQASAFVCTGGYTTVEMFQRGVTAAVTPDVEGNSPEPDLNQVKPGLDYVRQFSNGPAWEGRAGLYET